MIERASVGSPSRTKRGDAPKNERFSTLHLRLARSAPLPSPLSPSRNPTSTSSTLPSQAPTRPLTPSILRTSSPTRVTSSPPPTPKLDCSKISLEESLVQTKRKQPLDLWVGLESSSTQPRKGSLKEPFPSTVRRSRSSEARRTSASRRRRILMLKLDEMKVWWCSGIGTSRWREEKLGGAARTTTSISTWTRIIPFDVGRRWRRREG